MFRASHPFLLTNSLKPHPSATIITPTITVHSSTGTNVNSQLELCMSMELQTLYTLQAPRDTQVLYVSLAKYESATDCHITCPKTASEVRQELQNTTTDRLSGWYQYHDVRKKALPLVGRSHNQRPALPAGMQQPVAVCDAGARWTRMAGALCMQPCQLDHDNHRGYGELNRTAASHTTTSSGRPS